MRLRSPPCVYVVAEGAAAGVEKGKFHITYGFIGNTFRASTRGSSPGNSSLLDQVYMLIGMVRPSSQSIFSVLPSHLPRTIVSSLCSCEKKNAQIGLPLWRRDVDKQVRAHTEEHYAYLRDKGLLAAPSS